MENMAAKPKKRKKNKILPILISVFLLVYFVLQAYLMNSNKIETVKATEGFINDSILSSGIICREETILSEQIDGTINYNVENGQRVSSGMIIGDVYDNAQDIENIKRIGFMEEELENVKSAQSFMTSANIDISTTRKQLNNNIINIAQYLAVNDYYNACENLAALTLSINKINVATGKGGDLDSTKETMTQGIADLKQTVPSPKNIIYAQRPGYFIKGVDGYEEIATVENFKAISLQDGEAIITNPNFGLTQSSSYGKIITDYKWNLCTYVSELDAQKLKVDNSVKLALDSEQKQYEKAVVMDIIKHEGKSLVILQSSTMDESSAAKRIVDCEILFHQYKGIKIPRSALHIVDENLGVYVKFAKLVQFKKIKPIFEDANYVILPLEADENNEVLLFDDIIVKGVNLYNGKYL